MNPVTYPVLFLLFVQTFVPHICYHNSHPNCHLENRLNFTIHGLWPEYGNDSYPVFCNNTQLDLHQIEDLIPTMNQYWLSYESNNTDFWSHEYRKHATCDPNTTTHEYFDKTLDTFEFTDFNTIWNQNQIPLNTPIHRDSITHIFKAHPNCQKHTNEVMELWQCRYLNMTQFECPNWINNNCPSQVVFQ